MSPWVRRGILVGALACVGVAVWRWRTARASGATAVAGRSGPLPAPAGRSEPAATGLPPASSVAAAPPAAWVPPDAEGACPVSHPIKGKVRTGIYHPPGAFAYERTHADRCYRDADAAEADGLRAAKR